MKAKWVWTTLVIATATMAGCGDSGGPKEEVRVAVPEMSCANCMGTIRSALDKTPGVDSCQFDLKGRTVTVRVQAGKANRAAVEKAIVDSGFKVGPAAAK